jgi:hypothetical protein
MKMYETAEMGLTAINDRKRKEPKNNDASNLSILTCHGITLVDGEMYRTLL